MKTEVRKEHGDWIVFVDDNPQFSFMYREDAEKVRNMVDTLTGILIQIDEFPYTTPDTEQIEQVLKEIGVEL